MVWRKIRDAFADRTGRPRIRSWQQPLVVPASGQFGVEGGGDLHDFLLTTHPGRLAGGRRIQHEPVTPISRREPQPGKR